MAFTDGEFVLSVPNGLIRERVESRYLPMIEDTLANEVGAPVRGRLEVQEPEPAAAPVEPTTEQVFGLPPEPEPQPGPAPAPGRAGSRRRSSSTRNSPSRPSSPPRRTAWPTPPPRPWRKRPAAPTTPCSSTATPGSGKTHLLHAIGNYVTENYPRRKVLYVTTETFMNDFVDSLRTSTTLAFKRRYRDCDVLLIDDVQFMERKEGLQEEFFHTYNDLKGASKQIVLTSDRPPKSIETLEDRLRSRFLSGLITEIDPPDLETRLAILRSKSLSEHQEVPDDVLEFIASHVKDNIRELEGALTRICAFANLNKEPISLAQAEKVLSDLVLAGEPRRITPQMILDATVGQLRLLGRRHLRPEPDPSARDRPPGRHVPDQGAHGLQLSGHRPGLRQARPHHRHPRGGQDRRPNAGTTPDLRAGHRADPEDPCRLGLTVPSRRPAVRHVVVCRGQRLWTDPGCPGDQPARLSPGRSGRHPRVASGPRPAHSAMGKADRAAQQGRDHVVHNPHPLLPLQDTYTSPSTMKDWENSRKDMCVGEVQIRARCTRRHAGHREPCRGRPRRLLPGAAGPAADV